MKLYVVSAGIKEVVKESFYYLQSQMKENVFSNIELCMTSDIYDKNNYIVGFQKPTIITTNKHLFVSHEKYPEIKQGKNAIVMGDLIEDLQIIRNLKLKNVLSIGFFNSDPHDESSKKALLAYMDAFDIVIAFDGNLDYIVNILNYISTPPLPVHFEEIKKIKEPSKMHGSY